MFGYLHKIYVFLIFSKLEIIHYKGFHEQSVDGRAYMKMTNAKISKNGIHFEQKYTSICRRHKHNTFVRQRF